MSKLNAISPIDGRYNRQVVKLSPIFSEAGLFKHRLIVEGEYLIALFERIHLQKKLNKKLIKKLSDKEKSLIRSLYRLKEKDAQIISDIEFRGYKNILPTQHDVKAVEYYMKNKLENTSLKDRLEWIHFALTSEDTNNLAYALMLRHGLNDVIIPAIAKIIAKLNQLTKKYKNLPMLARTHGQAASPTTFGKEFKVFSSRLEKEYQTLNNLKISAKLNGATGNYNAHIVAFPKIDWIKFSKKFIESLNHLDGKGIKKTQHQGLSLKANIFTTQIEPHDSYVEIFDALSRINTILIDFNQDIWRYISDGWITQKAVPGEVGSSTMPHKINPIKFENSEGNLGIANTFFEFFARKLPISRLQRDLSDSTVERNFGSALSHCLIAYNYLLDGLNRISVNTNQVKTDLQSNPEVITEAIQTILRREGLSSPYEQLKKLSRGKIITLQDIKLFIKKLDIGLKIKKELLHLTPENYTGLADKITKEN